jgi:hypothetical protein
MTGDKVVLRPSPSMPPILETPFRAHFLLANVLTARYPLDVAGNGAGTSVSSRGDTLRIENQNQIPQEATALVVVDVAFGTASK